MVGGQQFFMPSTYPYPTHAKSGDTSCFAEGKDVSVSHGMLATMPQSASWRGMGSSAIHVTTG